MNEELLSAMMDGETSAFEIRRALNHIANDPEALARWERYNAARAALHGVLPARPAHGFAERVMRKLETAPAPQSPLHMLKPLMAYAAAASVVGLAAFGWWQASSSQRTVSVASIAEQSAPELSTAIASLEIETLPEDRALLNSYLVNHSEHAVPVMMPYGRLVGFSANGR